jgi:hypothetical protein
MKSYTITIPNNKENYFLEMMKSISFIKKIEAIEDIDIPTWHKLIIDQRLAAYKTNPSDVIDFNKACDDIEKDL